MKKLKVFMIMPFQDEFLNLYEMIKEKLGSQFEFSHAADLDNQQNILQDIVQGIANADVIIADLTGLNPNVFYELGLCHALNKKIILITHEISELPFDIKSYRVNEYSTNFWKINEIIDKIEKNLLGARDGSVQFGNPIKDYYPSGKTEESCEINTEENKKSNEDEKGLLDFIVDINDDTNNLTNEINEMQKGLNEMTQKIKYGITEINKVSKVPTSGNASFIRNIAKKVGDGVQEFANKMNIHNSKIEMVWERIENNFLDLIDNKYMGGEANKSGLIKSLKGLYDMKKAITMSNKQLEDMVTSFVSSKGIERKLTQAVNSLEEQMVKYLSIMNAIISSIDRIISKAELLVGKIDFESDIKG